MIKKSKSMSKSRLLKRLKKSQRSLKRKVKSLKRGPRGERSRGWIALAPRSVKEKELLYKKCKSKCFLLPNKKTPKKSKFPICVKPRNGRVSCKPNCKGLLSAKVRSRQFRGKSRMYKSVTNKANKVGKSLKCNWLKSKRKTPKRKSRVLKKKY